MDVQKKTINLSGMILVKMPVSNRNPIRTLCVASDGKMGMNSVLLKEMKEKTADMQVTFYRSEDYKKIIMLNSVQENSKFRFHRDGKLKHAEFASGLLECGYNLPAKYVVERDEEQDCWVGSLEEVPELKNPKALVKDVAVKKTAQKRK